VISLCGIPIETQGAWTEAESAVLRMFEGGASGAPFSLEAADEPLASLPPSGNSTILRWDGLVLLMSNPILTARLDFTTRKVAFQRSDADGRSLQILLRTLLTCELPRRGMLPLHAGAAIVDGRTIVFIGRSGAGKSTLAALSPHPLLSDELVAINPARGTSMETGFWGNAVIRPVAHRGEVPIRALLSLEKAQSNSLQGHTPAEAARSIVAATLVPASPLWSEALPLIDQASQSLAVRHLSWNKNQSPWPMIAASAV
jgi:hypothetical protein